MITMHRLLNIICHVYGYGKPDDCAADFYRDLTVFAAGDCPDEHRLCPDPGDDAETIRCIACMMHAQREAAAATDDRIAREKLAQQGGETE